MMERSDEKAHRLEQELEEARERLADAERAADDQVAEGERLEQRAAELAARGERLRREMHEPHGPLLPPNPTPATEEPGKS